MPDFDEVIKFLSRPVVSASWTITGATILAVLGSAYNNDTAWWILGVWTLLVLPPTYTIIKHDIEP